MGSARLVLRELYVATTKQPRVLPLPLPGKLGSRPSNALFDLIRYVYHQRRIIMAAVCIHGSTFSLTVTSHCTAKNAHWPQKELEK